MMLGSVFDAPPWELSASQKLSEGDINGSFDELAASRIAAGKAGLESMPELDAFTETHEFEQAWDTPPELPEGPHSYDFLVRDREWNAGQEGVNEAQLRALGYME